MGVQTRIAVLGLYNSGSTVLAGMLHRLGVNMGPPFWANSVEADEDNYYEPMDLNWHLRRWWDEPKQVEMVPAEERIRFLENWATLQEGIRPGPIGAKAPMLSLCGPDLIAAWGKAGLRFIWSWRPFDESLAGLQRREWFKGHDLAEIQQKIWNTISAFDSAHPGLLIRHEWNRVKKDPLAAARELASLAGIQPTPEQYQYAAELVKPPTPAKPRWWKPWK